MPGQLYNPLADQVKYQTLVLKPSCVTCNINSNQSLVQKIETLVHKN